MKKISIFLITFIIVFSNLLPVFADEDNSETVTININSEESITFPPFSLQDTLGDNDFWVFVNNIQKDGVIYPNAINFIYSADVNNIGNIEPILDYLEPNTLAWNVRTQIFKSFDEDRNDTTNDFVCGYLYSYIFSPAHTNAQWHLSNVNRLYNVTSDYKGFRLLGHFTDVTPFATPGTYDLTNLLNGSSNEENTNIENTIDTNITDTNETTSVNLENVEKKLEALISIFIVFFILILIIIFIRFFNWFFPID